MEDCWIVELYWQRDHSAIAETSAKYGAYCTAIAKNVLPDARDVEECVNDTWLGAWNAMPVQRPTLLGVFLGKITRNLAFSVYRAAHAEKRGGGNLPLVLEELTDCVPAAPSAAQAVEDEELAQTINRFLRTLTERDCNIFLRRYWYAEPLTEIAVRYGLKLNTVKTSLYRTRQRLKEYLEKEGIVL